jgi:V/A-type H+-transporting ATPase subunit K
MNLKKLLAGLVVANIFILVLAGVGGVVVSFFPETSQGFQEEGVVTEEHDAAEAGEGIPVPQTHSIWEWGFLSAALATGLSSVAAGIAVGQVGAAAMGAVSEKPELVGRALIFVGLAEGIAIYGLIIAIMILGRL